MSRPSNLLSARDMPVTTAGPRESRPYQLIAPRTPGAAPSWISEHATLAEAREAAVRFSAERRDLAGQDVRIELPDGTRVTYAGTGP